MARLVAVLEVQQHQIGDRKQVREPVFLFLIVKDTAGVQAGVDTPLLCLLEQLGEKGQLGQRFAAGGGDAAALIKALVLLVLVQKLVGGHHLAAGKGPGVRVVAEGAPHGAALKEHHEPDARPVHSAEAFHRMDAPGERRGLFGFHLTCLRGRYG